MNKNDFDRYKRYCKRYANAIFGFKSPDYEDSISEGLVAVVRALKTYNPDDESKASLNTYITASIKNAILSYKIYIDNRKLAEDSYMISRDEIIDNFDIDIVIDEDNTHNDLDFNYIIEIIDVFMKDITNEQLKQIYHKLFKEGKSLTEVSADLKIGVEPIRQHRQRIIQLLRYHLKNLNIGRI